MADLTLNDNHQKRGIVKIWGEDDSGNKYILNITKDGELKTQIDQDLIASIGNQEQVFVQDDESRNLLSSVLKQLKIANMHLSIMTDNYFKTSDVEV